MRVRPLRTLLPLLFCVGLLAALIPAAASGAESLPDPLTEGPYQAQTVDPFKAGTFLAVDLRCGDGGSRTVLLRVAHVADQADGTWVVGGEFAAPLSDAELAALL